MPAVAPQFPIITFYSPNKADQGVIEIWSDENAAYIPLDEGAPHPNTRDYPGYKLGKQQNVPNSQGWVLRIWVKDETNPVWWNWAQKFVSESNAHPIFIRTFREPRNTYTPATKSQPLKSVYKLTLTLAGSGYDSDPASFPALTFDNSGTGGTGAAGHAVVSKTGTITELVLDNGGSGYNTAPVFTIAAPGSGTTATGTATIQPATALLVAEEAAQFPSDSEFYGLYLSVVRVYQTLPGPILTSTLFDDDMLVQYTETEQEVVASTTIGTPSDGTTVELRKIDTVKSLRVITTKTPTAVTPETAIISYRTRPFQFPGLFPILPAFAPLGGPQPGTVIPANFRRARADLISVKVLTYFVTSNTCPVIAVDEIITDTILVWTMPNQGSDASYRQYEGVLHNAFNSDYIYGGVTITYAYSATTPSLADYIASWIGQEKIIARTVTPTRQRHLWKVELEKAVMR